MLIGLRDRLIRNRTRLANAFRGHAAEFGLTASRPRNMRRRKLMAWHRADRCAAAGDEDFGAWDLSIGPTLCA